MATISTVPEWNRILEVLADPNVSEVEANAPDRIFIKRLGERIKLDVSFRSEEHYMKGIEEGLVPLVKAMNAFDPSGYLFEGRLNYVVNDIEVSGRCHIVLPPSSDFPQVTIAKKTASLKTIDAIAAAGSMSTEMMEFLRAAVDANLTIVFSGGTGSGKNIYKNDLIPTLSGMKRAEEVVVGDVVFDERGERTTVVKKHSPKEKNFYKLTFNDGTVSRAGGGHVWKVLELSKRQKFGRQTRALFTPEQRSRVLTATQTPDTMLTFSEIVNVVNGNPINNPVGADERAKTLIHPLIQGFGVSGKDLFSFRKDEILALLDGRKNNTALSSRVRKDVESFDNDEISLGELRALIHNRAFSASLLGSKMSAKNKNVFYSKNEIFAHLLKEDDRRIAARAGLDESGKHCAHPTALITTDEIFERGVRNDKGRLNFAVEKITSPAEYEKKELLVDPYTLGAWLGDGESSGASIWGVDEEIIHKIQKVYGKPKVYEARRNEKTGNITRCWGFKNLHTGLRKLGVRKNKHIPQEYLTASVEQREELLAGLIDTDGTFDYKQGVAIIEMTNERIVLGAREIAASLGWNVSKVSQRRAGYRDENGEFVPCKDKYSFRFYPESQLDLQVPRKREALNKRLLSKLSQSSRHDRHYIASIEKIDGDYRDYYCFGVDSPFHTYLTGETFIPTHNTTMLESLAKSIPDSLRIGVAEDVPELKLPQPNVTYLHSVPWQPGMDANDVATLSWVVQQFQRMRTDKIIIGETRGKEFADFLVAANSGMEGSMTTIHADDPMRCLMKMTGFAMKGSEKQPIRAINNDIANAVDLIVQLVIVDGRHRVSHIQEVVPTLGNTEEAKITSASLYCWDRQKDMFYKDNVMTDKLRERMIDHHVNIESFLKSQRELRVPAHGGVRSKAPQIGLPRNLPIRPGGRSL